MKTPLALGKELRHYLESTWDESDGKYAEYRKELDTLDDFDLIATVIKCGECGRLWTERSEMVAICEQSATIDELFEALKPLAQLHQAIEHAPRHQEVVVWANATDEQREIFRRALRRGDVIDMTAIMTSPKN